MALGFVAVLGDGAQAFCLTLSFIYQVTITLVMIGHSFGDTARFSATAPGMEANLHESYWDARRYSSESDAVSHTMPVVTGYGDVVMCTNPAMETPASSGVSPRRTECGESVSRRAMRSPHNSEPWSLMRHSTNGLRSKLWKRGCDR